jgi:hypothetical protein
MSAPELPKYTSWDQVPDSLYTRTQLAALDPPRRLAKGAQPAARVLYMGNKYADLYRLEDTVVKPPPTDAQLRAVRRASAARHICKRCDARTHPSVTADSPPQVDVDPFDGRLCGPCRTVLEAHRQHTSYRQQAQRTMEEIAGRGAVVVHGDTANIRGGTDVRRLVLVEYPPNPGGAVDVDAGQVILDVHLVVPGEQPVPGRHTYEETIGRVHGMFDERPNPLPLWVGWTATLWPLVVVATGLNAEQRKARVDDDDRAGRVGAERWNPWDVTGRYWWMRQQWGTWEETGPGQKVRVGILHAVNVVTPWSHYYAQPDPSSGCDLRWYRPAHLDAHPAVSGDPVEDARLIMRALAQVADGTEPVSGRAPWLAHPAAVPGWDGV